ncbi:MAG: NADH-quinone oxidoreductase subunit J [Acetobacteraceae bacterium]
MAPTVFFYLFSIVLVLCAAMVVSARNPVHSVLFLIGAFFNAAGLFLIAGAEFLAFILVIVYVGAVAVLFLFVVMMLDVDFEQMRSGMQRYLPVGVAVGVLLLAELVFVMAGWQFHPAMAPLRFAPAPAGVSNTVALGDLIYTKYILLFQASGLVLLVAMIGAIVLTLRDRRRSRHQHIALQNAREPGEAVQLLDVVLGAGVRAQDILRPKITEPDGIDDDPLVPAAGGHHPADAHHAPEGR